MLKNSAHMNKKIIQNGKKVIGFFSISAIVIAILSAAIIFPAFDSAYAQEQPCAIDDVQCFLQQVFERNTRRGGPELKNFSQRFHELSSVESGADTLTTIIFITLDFLKMLLGTIAVLMVIYVGAKLVVSGEKSEEEFTKTKQALTYIILGFLLIIIADELVTTVFFGEFGECIASSANAQQCAQEGSNLIEGITNFILAILASVAVLVIVVAGFRMAANFGNDEVIEKEKKHLLWAIAGLILAGIAEFIVKVIIFPKKGSELFNIQEGIELVARLTNFAAGFIATGSFLMLLYGGGLYVASFGSEDMTGKAKKAMLGAVIGIAIALLAFGIVQTVSTLA